MITIIDANTATIENAADLNELVSANIEINYIYFVADITLTGGITIHPGRTSLTIDGQDYNSGVIHSFTDINSTSSYVTLGIRATSNITITVKNMVINGYNYFGVPYIAEGALGIDTHGVSVIYDNVSYRGPQMVFNRDGLTRILNSEIEIVRTNGTEAQEVGEVNRLELGGTVRIHHRATVTHAVFWFCDETTTSSLTVLENADVEIISDVNYLMYSYDGALGPTTRVPVQYVIHQNAQLRINVSKGIGYDANHQIDSFLVEENALFRYVQSSNNGSVATLYMNGALEVREGADFYMQASNGTQPLIRFTSGTSRSLTVNNPKSFVLYNPNAAALNSQGTTQFVFHAGQLNEWTTAITPVESAGDFNDIAQLRWFKKDFLDVLEVQGSFGVNTTTATSNLVSPDDDPFTPITDLSLHSARVLSMGDWIVTVNIITDNGRPVTGTTEPNANLQLEYTTDISVDHLVSGRADGNGDFSISTTGEDPTNIPAGTEVSIWSNIPFLIKKIISVAVEAGEIFIQSAPIQIRYRVAPFSTNPVLLPRPLSDVPVVVVDDLAVRSRWNLLATISGPMSTVDGDTLTDAVVFRYFNESGDAVLVTLTTDNPTIVYTGGDVRDTIYITWPEQEGILLRITNPMRVGVEYSTQLYWDLQVLND